MFKAFLKDSAIYGIGSILARAISLLLLPFYTRVLTPRDYGVVDLLTTFGALVNLTVALEISQGLARYVAAAENEEERAEWASTALWFTVGTLSLFAAIAFAFAGPLSAMLLESRELAFVFGLGVISILFNGIFYVGQAQLRWMRKPAHYSTANLVFTVSAIVATVLFVLYFRFGVAGVVLGQMVGYLIGAVLTLWFARSDFRLKFSLEKCKRMLRFSLPLVPSSIAVFVAGYIDCIAIKELMDVKDVGIYGVGYRLASPVALLTAGFQTAITPLVIANYKDPATRETIARIFRYFLVVAMLACVGVSVFAR
ncbi:MAG TPA: oligosaccharide flippase family protein, partial [Thermoanaerobaculia bacterium]|nr:oligosaccharide flippase family protein [Thermoanaerobaculia bacterium]